MSVCLQNNSNKKNYYYFASILVKHNPRILCYRPIFDGFVPSECIILTAVALFLYAEYAIMRKIVYRFCTVY